MGTNNTIRLAFKSGFENRCIKLLVSAYQSAISAKCVSPDWDENDITAQLNNYIDVHPKRYDWGISTNVEHHIPNDKEPITKGSSARFSRIDMRFSTFNSKIEYRYYLEAKNLVEKGSALKRRYINTGIDSFLSGKYKNGVLVGYLLAGNLANTVDGINNLLIKDSRDAETLKKTEFKYHDSFYESTHTNIGILKHLIFDFTAQ